MRSGLEHYFITQKLRIEYIIYANNCIIFIGEIGLFEMEANQYIEAMKLTIYAKAWHNYLAFRYEFIEAFPSQKRIILDLLKSLPSDSKKAYKHYFGKLT